jgi:GNAT superfamily N-acetyltransferase
MNTVIVVKRVSPGDGDIIDILADYHAKEFGVSSGREAKDRVKEMQAHAKKKPGSSAVPMTLIALINGELAGSCKICEDDFDGARPNMTPWLATLFVLPTHRGKGVGSALANKAAFEVKSSGCGDVLYLWACEREVALGMYQKLGWKIVEETVPPNKEEFDLAIIMKRDL